MNCSDFVKLWTHCYHKQHILTYTDKIICSCYCTVFSSPPQLNQLSSDKLLFRGFSPIKCHLLYCLPVSSLFCSGVLFPVEATTVISPYLIDFTLENVLIGDS